MDRSGYRRLTCNRIGTFYNAVRNDENRLKVKEWAWEAYPEAYEELLKLGQYELVKSSGEGEDELVYSRETFFDIRAIGRDVQP